MSLVPSWTETLLEAGLPVVGKTRFCNHPSGQLKTIPNVGGTKDIDWSKVQSLKPDVLLLDKEENPKEFFDQSPYPCIVTHVEDLKSMGEELKKLAMELKSPKLFSMLEDLKKLEIDRSLNKKIKPGFAGELEWIHNSDQELEKILYVIWKNPWMAASAQTFVGSTLSYLFGPIVHFAQGQKYPTVEIEQYNSPQNAIFYSSEPYPFVKKKAELPQLTAAQILVDGESFSWFGIRSIRFLTKANLL
ncbi:MAG: helical backbone metal receptor [Pseudobdellovibrionaceae bacterium]